MVPMMPLRQPRFEPTAPTRGRTGHSGRMEDDVSSTEVPYLAMGMYMTCNMELFAFASSGSWAPIHGDVFVLAIMQLYSHQKMSASIGRHRGAGDPHPHGISQSLTALQLP